MWAVTDRWLPEMETDTLTIATFGLIYPAVGTPNNNIPLAMFSVVNGQVNVDVGNAVRRTLAECEMIPAPEDDSAASTPPIVWATPPPWPGFTVPSSITVPTTEASDLLFPDGNELALWKGCTYSDGTTEVAPLGRFLMEDVEIYNVPNSGALYIQLNGEDRAATIARAEFTAPYSTDGVSGLDVQVLAMLNNQVSWMVPSLCNFSPGTDSSGNPITFPVPVQVNCAVGDDPWAAAQGIASSCGYELFFDAIGMCVMRQVVDSSFTAPLVSYTESADSAIVSSVQRSLVNTGVPNLVVVMSQGSNVPAPIRSVWWDSDPASNTFYNSAVPPLAPGDPIPDPEGTYPTTTISSTSSTAPDQASNDAAAQSMWLANKGRFETIDFKIRDNPAQDVEDVVNVISTKAGVPAPGSNYVLDTITFQLDFSSEQEMKGRVALPL